MARRSSARSRWPSASKRKRVATGRPFEIELSVDETAAPTTLAEHYIIAEQLAKAGIRVVSLAPRFIGDFEKGVDYKGDLAALEASMQHSCRDCRAAGPVQDFTPLGFRQAVDVSGAGARDGRPLSREDGRHELAGSAARRRPLRSTRCSARSSTSRGRRTTATRRPTTSPPRSHRRLRRPKVSDPVSFEQIYLERWDDVPHRAAASPRRAGRFCTARSDR